MLRKTAFICAMLTLLVCSGCDEQFLASRALAVHERALTVDTHVDTPVMIKYTGIDVGVRNEPGEIITQVDFPRMLEGGLDAEFFAVFVGQGPRNELGYAKSKATALELFDIIGRALVANPDVAERALTSADAARIEALGKCAIYIGIENGYAIGRDLSLIETYYDMGARYIGLCHVENNDICDSSTSQKGPEHNGLSDFGREVVREMNRLGMMVDVSHISDAAFYDVLEVSSAPVIASHSGARAVYGHPRHMTDDMLRALAENGGVIQAIMMYVKEDDPDNPATLSDFVDHIDHIVSVAGIDHVGIGSDFDGGGGVEGCSDVSQMPSVTLELLKRGYTEPQIRKIWGGNFLRVFGEIEEASAN